MATASYLATVSVTGTSTGLTAAPGEPMTDLGIGGARVTWQITDATKRIVDPANAIVIYDDNAGAPWGGTYTIDYLNGTVTLSVAAATTIKIQGNYLPARQIANAYEMSVSLTKTLTDTSLLGTAHTQRTAALGDITGSFGCYAHGLTTYGGDVKLGTLLIDGTTKIVEMDLSQTILRFFAMFESIEASASVDGVQTMSASFSMNSQTAVTTGQEVDFAWSA